MLKKILCLLSFILLSFASFGQLTTEGREFWMGFMENSEIPQALRLFITSKKNINGQVSIPLENWSQNFTVAPNTTRIIDVPVNLAHTVGEGIQRRGIRITANDTISVFAINNRVNTTDGTVVLPTRSLGLKPTYIVSSFSSSLTDNSSEFLIVANENNTPIRITYTSGAVEDLILNQGEVFQRKLTTLGSDVSGTIIEGIDECKTFAVFAGVECVNIPANCPRCDHIFDQLYPTATWDRAYLVTPFGVGRDEQGFSLEQNGGYMIRIYRTDNTTTATIDGAPVSWTGAGGRFAQIDVNGLTPRFIQASAPISVAQYMKSQACNGLPRYITDEVGNPNALAKGDPSMLMLNPNNQTVKSVIFNTVTTSNLSNHFVNLIIRTADIGTLRLDGQIVTADRFKTFPANPDYAYAPLQIANGSHRAECPTGLIAYCYGVGERESYAYSAGASFDNLQYKFTIQDNYSITTSGNASSCTETLIQFLGIGEDAIQWAWNFGDNTPIQTGQNTTHTYTKPGNYTVKLTVTVVDGCGTRDIEVIRILQIFPFPKPDLGGNQAFCTNTPLILDAGEFGPNNTYSWSTGATTRTIEVTTPGQYAVNVTNQVGCSASSSIITVTQLPLPVLNFTNLADAYCANAPSFSLLSVVSPNTPPASATFTIDGNITTILAPSILSVGSHLVEFKYKDSNTGCENSIQKQIEIKAVPNLNFVDLADSYCANDTAFNLFVKVNPSNTTQGSFTVNGVPTNIFNPAMATVGVNYLIVYTYQDPITQCTQTISKTLVVKPIPTVIFSNLADTYCVDTQLNLFNTVTPSNINTGIFSINGGTPLTTNTAQNFTFSTLTPNQNYTFRYTYTEPATNCQQFVEKNIGVNPLPVVNFVNLSTVYCPKDAPFNLFDKVNPSNTTTGNFTINGITSTIFNPSVLQAGAIHRIVYTYTDPNTQCTQTIQQEVSIPNLPQFVGLGDVYCQDSPPILLQANPTGGTFRINGNIVTELNPALYGVGKIQVSYTDAGNCAVTSKEIEILAPFLPTLVINDEDICSEFGVEEPIVLDAGEGVSYRWLLNNATTRLLTVTQSGNYSVEVINVFNCVEIRTIQVNERLDCDPRIFVPTAFSPNGDGLNDEFKVFGKYFTDFKITIYNRWGEIVFQSKNRDQTWDGTLSGKDVPTGVYVCTVEYRKLNSSTVEKLTTRITLIR